MKILLLPFFLLPALALCGQRQPDSAWIDSTLSRMTLEEKIGQLFMIAAYSNRDQAYENTLEAQIRQYHIGGVIFFQGDPVRQVKLTNRFQRAAQCPLLIGMDAEHGIGWRLASALEFPQMLIAGAVRDDSLIFGLGAAIARHCRQLGVHVNFAPVVDLNSNPKNPVIGMRSFGEQKAVLTHKAILYMQGTLSEQILPVAKHFPGHGDTDTDSHLALPLIRHDRRRLDSIELYPYRKIIEAGVPAVMTAHLNVRALDTTGLPASLSPAIVNGLLKQELGFQGLCFTDAMNMKGVGQHTAPGEAEVKALLAGNDVLLFPADLEKAVRAIRQAVADRRIDEAALTAKCRKILTAKCRYVRGNRYPAETPGLWSRLHTPEDFALKQNLYKAALTLIKNTDSLLPLKRLDTLKIASINFGSPTVNNFQTFLNHYTAVCHFTAEKQLTEAGLKAWQQKLAPYNCIIIYNHLASNAFSRNFGYAPSLAALIRKLSGKRIIFCQPGIPYGLAPYLELPVDAFLISYEDQLYPQQYAAQALFGGTALNGQLPVSIDAAHPAGYGLRTRKTRLGYQSPEMGGISSSALAGIDSLCRYAIQSKATPGCQVLLARDGNILYHKTFGHHTYERKKATQATDIYDIASVTKITATLPAIMKLYDDRRICLHAPLSDYYPPLQNTDKKAITVYEVLCHHAGLKAFIPFFAEAVDPQSLPGPLFSRIRTARHTTRLKNRLYADLDYRFRDSTLSNTPKPGYRYAAPGLYLFPAYRDSVLHTILNLPLNPEKAYLYSDIGFILLKYAFEEIAGQPLDDFCKRTFYRKLGMTDTDFKASERLDKSRIVPSCIDKLYRKTEICGTVHDPAAALLDGIAGHAGLFSTAEDLAKMMQLYLNRGNYGGEYYFAPETVSTFTGRNTLFPHNRRGLGFDKPEADSLKTSPVCSCAPPSSFGHTGFTGIMAWCDPENRLIYIFLSNRTYPNEFNTRLSEENIRTKIQEVIYQAIGKRPAH